MKHDNLPKDLGILFRGDMVRAILAGAKTQTRRGMEPQPTVLPEGTPTWYPSIDSLRRLAYDGEDHFRRGVPVDFARHHVGRRLWVKETWRPTRVTPAQDGEGRRCSVLYRADGQRVDHRCGVDAGWRAAGMMLDEPVGKWRPSLLMPRWASRINLMVTAIRAERLTEITPDDVLAEGFGHAGLGSTSADYCRAYRAMSGLDADADPWV